MSADSIPQFANEPTLELRRAPDRDALTDALGEAGLAAAAGGPGDDRRRPRVGGRHRLDRPREPGPPGRPGGGRDRGGRRRGGGCRRGRGAGVGRAQRPPIGRRCSAGPRRCFASAGWSSPRSAVRECAKPWAEADADICEAIDFIEYYRRDAIDLEAGAQLIQVQGERNRMTYAPRGVAGVISPWNFPLAIPTGMVAAGLAAGNAVVFKPAEQSPGCGGAIVAALHEAGVPRGALALVPGYGEAGAALVRHPGVQVIAFTGSAAVGQEVIRSAAETLPGQQHVKRVVAEMGGKNCVIVDADADLDDAVPAIVTSAFAYAGQKCSAASRVIAHEAVAEGLGERLAGAVEVLSVGQAERFGTDVPPLIEREAQERVRGYGETAAAEGRVLARAAGPGTDGWFCDPVVVTGLEPGSRVLREEIFGPLLAVEAVPDLEAACEIVESLPFALTGGLFSRNPRAVDEVARRLPVGNLYINRATTGAMVGRQPFGGNKLSGVGSKAGGPGLPRAVRRATGGLRGHHAPRLGGRVAAG